MQQLSYAEKQTKIIEAYFHIQAAIESLTKAQNQGSIDDPNNIYTETGIPGAEKEIKDLIKLSKELVARYENL